MIKFVSFWWDICVTLYLLAHILGPTAIPWNTEAVLCLQVLVMTIDLFIMDRRATKDEQSIASDEARLDQIESRLENHSERLADAEIKLVYLSDEDLLTDEDGEAEDEP